MIDVTDEISLDERDIEIQFTRASGPGGQHVNKTSTAVQLRFNVVACDAIPEEVKARLIKFAGSRMTLEGVLVITSQRYRGQDRNRQDAIDRLVALIRQASVPPKPRHRTKPSKAAKQERLEDKRKRSTVKSQRRGVSAKDFD